MTTTAPLTWPRRRLFESTEQRIDIRGLMRFRLISIGLRRTLRSANCENENDGSWFLLPVSFSQTTEEKPANSIHRMSDHCRTQSLSTRSGELRCSVR